MHALHKILAVKVRPRRAAVTPGEYIEIEPDAYSAIVQAKRSVTCLISGNCSSFRIASKA